MKKKKDRRVVGYRHYKAGYEVRHEFWDSQIDGCKELEMKEAYNPHGDWIGKPKFAKRLSDRGIAPIKAHKRHCICSIGYCAEKRMWYGWSHRAICGFGIGDMVFNERMRGRTDHTPFKKHGTVKIESLEQAKKAAINFARSVS